MENVGLNTTRSSWNRHPILRILPTILFLELAILHHNMGHGRFVTALHNHFQGHHETNLLSWKEFNEGPANALMWTAVCKVRGEVLGSGTAHQLRVAREQAAQSACQTLGITA